LRDQRAIVRLKEGERRGLLVGEDLHAEDLVQVGLWPAEEGGTFGAVTTQPGRILAWRSVLGDRGRDCPALEWRRKALDLHVQLVARHCGNSARFTPSSLASSASGSSMRWSTRSRYFSGRTPLSRKINSVSE